MIEIKSHEIDYKVKGVFIDGECFFGQGYAPIEVTKNQIAVIVNTKSYLAKNYDYSQLKYQVDKPKKVKYICQKTGRKYEGLKLFFDKSKLI